MNNRRYFLVLCIVLGLTLDTFLFQKSSPILTMYSSI